MSRRSLVRVSLAAIVVRVFALTLGGAGEPTLDTGKPLGPAVTGRPAAIVISPPPVENVPPVMLGIDVLEADQYAIIAGKKIGLLTHPAGVNRRGESTIDVLRRAPNARLVALFAPEHGIGGREKAGENFGDTVDQRTGLPVYSLYGRNSKPTKAQLKGLDALVVDLQDIGVRSYSFNVVMRYAIDACFENGVEVIVLDRPNPLGGFKVDGPPLDPENMSGVGAFPGMPYVHGLTLGEIARLAKNAPRSLSGSAVSDAVREKGRLTVVPMRGWRREMRWPETGLPWIATSTLITSFESAVGYAMVGLGTQNSGWTSGIGAEFPFRSISFPRKTPDEIINAITAYQIPGISLIKRQGLDRNGRTLTGAYVQIVDWEAWHPTELAFYMHKQAAIWRLLNPFALLSAREQSAFKTHVGSTAWYSALSRDGGKVDVTSFVRAWAQHAKAYQDETRKYWLYD